jgi:CheY-like chemotaxis protein/HPt (histidine-containing phosphotransfer) domain-containing protein
MSTTTDNPQTPEPNPVRILVAEDSPLNQQVALKQLESLGYQADAVADGAQAVEAQARTGYDVVLMDCQMPGTNGYDATMLIRVREQEQAAAGVAGKRAYIIAMTANTETDIRERCTAAGMDDYINKPVYLPELEVALRRAFSDRNATKAIDDIIDPVVIAGLRRLRAPGKPDPLGEFIDLFLHEAPIELDAMSNAVSRNDATCLSETISAASALKGSAGNLGARRLAALCEEIEQTAKDWVLADAKPIVEQARREFDQARAVLETLKRG